MPVAEILAGISLVKASVDFIKSNIQTAQDIGDIAGAVDDLFKGHDEAQKQRSKKSGVGGVGGGGFSGATDGGTGGNWGQAGTAASGGAAGLAGSGILDNGATVTLYGATAARYINGNGSHP